MGASIDASSLTATIDTLLANKEKALEAAGVALLAADQQTITDQGNGNWPPRRSLPKSPHPLLELTGALMGSLAKGGAGNVFTVDGDTVTVGSDLPYAALQDQGDRHLPARPFMNATDEKQKAAEDAYKDAINDGVS